MFHSHNVRVAAYAALIACVSLVVLSGLHYVHAIEIPPPNSQAFIQTNGPNTPLANGDYYTNEVTGGGPHIVQIDVPCTWPADVPVTVAVYDPESFDPEVQPDPPALDQVAGEADTTNFVLKDPAGNIIVDETYPSQPFTNGRWVELYTFLPSVNGPACQTGVTATYTLETTTSDNDEQSWRLQVTNDPGCGVTPGNCTFTLDESAPEDEREQERERISQLLNDGDENDNFDGINGTGDELSIGMLQVSYEHAGPECQNFWFFVERSETEDPREVTLHNFDMDNRESLTYFTPSGREIEGVVSGFTVWNNGEPGDLDAGIPPERVGETYTVPMADVGWWRAELCTAEGNQYIFEAEQGEPVRFEPASTPEMAVSKDDGQTVTRPGAQLTYTILFTNTSDTSERPGAAANVTLNDTLPENSTFVSCQLDAPFEGTCEQTSPGTVNISIDGVVAAGASGSAQVTVQVNQDATGDVVNAVELTYTDILGKRFPPETDEDVNVIPPGPNIEATKRVEAIESAATGECEALVNETLRYTVVISNTGGEAATGVVFQDTPDPNTSLIVGSVSATPGSVTSGNNPGDSSVGVTIGTLEAEQSVTITYEVTVNATLPQPQTEVVNQGQISGDNFDPIVTDDPTTPTPLDETRILACSDTGEAPPTLEATKRVVTLNSEATGECQALSGETLRYTVIVSNTGNADITNVQFQDSPDANTTLIAGSVNAVDGSVTSGNTAGDTNVAVDLGTLASGASKTIIYDVQLNDSLPQAQTEIVNQGTVTAEEVEAIVTDDPTTVTPNDPTVTIGCRITTEPAPELDATKVVEALNTSATGECQVLVNETLRYTVIVSNTSDVEATSVQYSDILDSNSTLVAGTVSAGAGTVTSGNSAGDTSVAVNIGTLAGGASVTIVYEATVNDQLPQPQTVLANQGVVTADELGLLRTDDPTTTLPRDPTEILACVEEVAAPPILEATKTVTSQSTSAAAECRVLAGESLEYSVVIANNDTTPAFNVVYSDTLDANTELVPGTLQTTRGTPTVSSTADGQTLISVDIGQVNPGEQVTITYETNVLRTLPSDRPVDIVNQGTLTWEGGSTLTDDPTVMGAQDPTRISACLNLTAIELESFTTRRQGNTIVVNWVTSAEIDTWGFHLLRSSDGSRESATRVTSRLILAKGRGQGGASYRWTDRDVADGVSYTYWIEETELNGNTIVYGPADNAASQNLDKQIYLPIVRR